MSMGMPCESSYYESHEEDQSFLDGMLSDFREDALRSAARTEGIDRKFWLTVAEKVA